MYKGKNNSGIVKLFILNMLFVLFFTSCNDELSVEIPLAKTTMLVYMVADNTLSGEVGNNMNSIMAGVENNTLDGNVLVYTDQSGSVPQLINIVKKKDGTVVKNIVKTYEEQNSVNPSVMASVFKDMINKYPAESYGLVLWSHGYGWLQGGNNTKTVSTRWFGQDENNKMDISDLVMALQEGPYFRYILFDACFMGNAETAYALRNCTDYLIASPTEVLSGGFPYSDIIPYLMSGNESDYVKIASLYYNYYNEQTGYYRSASVGVTKCNELEALAAEINKLITAHATALNTFNASSVQYLESYIPHLFYDLGNFVENFSTEAERASFEQQLSKTVVYSACTPDVLSVSSSGTHFIPVNHFSGLSTYIPGSNNLAANASYHTMEWYTAAGWNKTAW
ncbi:MAG: clostripain [Bacteroidetes bacterium]|nr:clostripain [Bacteroidota bacterium]